MGINICLLAHASIEIDVNNKIIYFDPSTKGTGLKKGDFKPADLILVTHDHPDHFDKDLLKKIRKGGSPIIAPGNVKKEFGGVGVWDVDPGQFMKTGDGIEIKGVEAYNVKRFRSPGTPFHPKGLGAGYIVQVAGKKFYHAGDTDLIPEMESLGEAGIDVAFIPAGDTFTMDLHEAAEATLIIKPRIAIPIHLKGADPAIFKEEVESRSSTKVVVLNPGDVYALE